MQKSNNFKSFRTNAHERLDQLLDILGGDQNIESFSISKNKMIVEVSSLNDVEIDKLHRTGSRRVDVCPAIVAFDLDDELLNLIIKILVNNGNFEFNYSSIKNQLSQNDTQTDNNHFERINFKDINYDNDFNDDLYYKDKYNDEYLDDNYSLISNKTSHNIEHNNNINDFQKNKINQDFKPKVISLQEYLDYHKDNRIHQWKMYSIINDAKKICNCCQEAHRILIKFNNGAYICVNCWLKKPTEENIEKLINLNKINNYKNENINTNIYTTSIKDIDNDDFFVDINKNIEDKPLSNIKTNLIKEEKTKSISKIKTIGNNTTKNNLKSQSIILSKADRKWISRGIKDNEDN